MIGLGRMPEVSNALSGIFRFFQGFGEGGHDFEDVADYAVVGDFEDGALASLLMATMVRAPFMQQRVEWRR